MIFTWILTGIVIISLFSGKLPIIPLLITTIAICVIGYSLLKRHNHHRAFLSLDAYAQRSHMNKYSAGLKTAFAISISLICIAANSIYISLFVFVTMGWITVFIGKTRLSYYISLLIVPSSFVLLSGIAILYQISDTPFGIIDLPLYHSYISVTPTGQHTAMLIMARAFGAVSCLYMLSLSTPIYEIIGLLRILKVPDIVIELMYLIYRYLFILLSMFSNMETAAKSRLAEHNQWNFVKTMIQYSSNLLFLSFRKSSSYFDAMESRCYDGEIRFLENKRKIHLKDIAFVAIYVLLIGCLWFIIKRRLI